MPTRNSGQNEYSKEGNEHEHLSNRNPNHLRRRHLSNDRRPGSLQFFFLPAHLHGAQGEIMLITIFFVAALFCMSICAGVLITAYDFLLRTELELGSLARGLLLIPILLVTATFFGCCAFLCALNAFKVLNA